MFYFSSSSSVSCVQFFLSIRKTAWMVKWHKWEKNPTLILTWEQGTNVRKWLMDQLLNLRVLWSSTDTHDQKLDHNFSCVQIPSDYCHRDILFTKFRKLYALLKTSDAGGWLIRQIWRTCIIYFIHGLDFQVLTQRHITGEELHESYI